MTIPARSHKTHENVWLHLISAFCLAKYNFVKNLGPWLHPPEIKSWNTQSKFKEQSMQFVSRVRIMSFVSKIIQGY